MALSDMKFLKVTYGEKECSVAVETLPIALDDVKEQSCGHLHIEPSSVGLLLNGELCKPGALLHDCEEGTVTLELRAAEESMPPPDPYTSPKVKITLEHMKGAVTIRKEVNIRAGATLEMLRAHMSLEGMFNYSKSPMEPGRYKFFGDGAELQNDVRFVEGMKIKVEVAKKTAANGAPATPATMAPTSAGSAAPSTPIIPDGTFDAVSRPASSAGRHRQDLPAFMEEGKSIEDITQYLAAQKLEATITRRATRSKTSEELKEHTAHLELLKAKMLQFREINGGELRSRHEQVNLMAEIQIMKAVRKLVDNSSTAADAAYGPLITTSEPVAKRGRGSKK
jgi:hypothetical protein